MNDYSFSRFLAEGSTFWLIIISASALLAIALILYPITFGRSLKVYKAYCAYLDKRYPLDKSGEWFK